MKMTIHHNSGNRSESMFKKYHITNSKTKGTHYSIEIKETTTLSNKILVSVFILF